MRNLIVAIVLFIIGLGIGYGVTFVYGDQILAFASGPYSLPKNLTYDASTGWEDLSGDGWKISVDEDWGLQEALEGTSIYASVDESLALLVLKSPEKKSFDEYKKDLEDSEQFINDFEKSSGNLDDAEILKSQQIKVNGNETIVVYMKADANNIDFFTVLILMEKGNEIYFATFAMPEKFYEENKAEVKTFISSFR